jgi:uncharacterized membrane protein YeaQ/YmgE (transglycosylase-associated protein family)
MFLVWIVTGLVSGLVANQLVQNQNMDVLSHIILGIIGSFVGAFLFDNVFKPDVVGSHFWGILISALGSVMWIIAYYSVVGCADDEDKD